MIVPLIPIIIHPGHFRTFAGYKEYLSRQAFEPQLGLDLLLDGVAAGFHDHQRYAVVAPGVAFGSTERRVSEFPPV